MVIDPVKSIRAIYRFAGLSHKLCPNAPQVGTDARPLKFNHHRADKTVTDFPTSMKNHGYIYGCLSFAKYLEAPERSE